jgi:UDP-N-acetylglucosamine--N-acetylmuramyl-(pentapeptide) pyrophosphoryl-undecaprenol N-acetylglucosamine transferase
MRVLLCGGGTAGHVMPAIAIAEIIEKSFKGSVIAFAGREDGPENNAYLNTGHRLYTIDIQGISRSLSINNVKSILKVIKSGRMSKNVIRDFNPDIIIGTGGYVCYPFIRQGQRMKIKTVIHESNVAPGLVTRILGHRCDLLLLNLEGTKKNLKAPENTIVVGNPTRKSFDTISKADARKRLRIPDGKKLIVSFGGSLGADLINKTVLSLMSRHSLKNPDIYHIHATGKSHYWKIRENHPELFKKQDNLSILPYIEDMPTVLTAADIAITRSGAITISELIRSKTPSILIPSPNVTANHQYYNAKYMESLGCSILIEEKDLNVESLEDAVFGIISYPEKISAMTESLKKASTKDTELLIQKSLSVLIKR